MKRKILPDSFSDRDENIPLANGYKYTGLSQPDKTVKGIHNVGDACGQASLIKSVGILKKSWAQKLKFLERGNKSASHFSSMAVQLEY